MKQKSFETMLNRLIGLTPDQVESLIATDNNPADCSNNLDSC